MRHRKSEAPPQKRIKVSKSHAQIPPLLEKIGSHACSVSQDEIFVSSVPTTPPLSQNLDSFGHGMAVLVPSPPSSPFGDILKSGSQSDPNLARPGRDGFGTWPVYDPLPPSQPRPHPGARVFGPPQTLPGRSCQGEVVKFGWSTLWCLFTEGRHSFMPFCLPFFMPPRCALTPPRP